MLPLSRHGQPVRSGDRRLEEDGLTEKRELTTGEALQEWREAVAVARRGTGLAETSATKTAAAAKQFVQATMAESADADSDTAVGEIEEAAAQSRYRSAVSRAAEKDGSPQG